MLLASRLGRTRPALVVLPDVLALLFHVPQGNSDLFQLGNDIQHSLVDSLEIPVIGLSPLPREQNIQVRLLLELGTQPLGTDAAAARTGGRASRATTFGRGGRAGSILATRPSRPHAAHVSIGRRCGRSDGLVCLAAGPRLRQRNLRLPQPRKLLLVIGTEHASAPGG